MSLMENLLNLSRVDAQVRGLRKRLDSARTYLESQTQQYHHIQQQLSETQTRKRHLQATIANLETEVVGIDAKLEKFRSDLNTSVTNKQYTTVLSEMNTVKDQRSEVEDRILELMEQVEATEKEIEQIQELLNERAKLRDHAQSQFNERESEVGNRLEELEQEREAAAKAVPGRERAIFDDLAEVHDGEAIAKIIEIDRKYREYACDACNMRVTFEQVSQAITSNDAIVRCTACDRILYMHEELRCELTTG